MTNCNPVKQLFITFPHSTVDKVEFRDTLLRFDPSYYKVCEEKHKDGTPHLHAVIKFKNKFSKSFVVKYFKTIYPDEYKRIDVKPVRSIKKSIEYLSKEDTQPLESGEFKDSRNPQLNWIHKFATELGYDSLAHFTDEYKVETDNEEKFKAIFHERYRFMVENDPYQIDYRIKSIYKNVFDKEFVVTKDDMTYICKEFNIKYESTTHRGFPMVITENPQ